MTWWAIDVPPDPSRREWVGAGLVARTGQAVEGRGDGTPVAFAEDNRAADELVAALAAASAVGLENDAEANPAARRNAARNGIVNAVEFLEGDAGDLGPLLGPADLLLSNILRTANTALLPQIVAALRPGGLAIFSGLEEPEAAIFRPLLAAAGLTVRDEVADDGWWAVAAVRP